VCRDRGQAAVFVVLVAMAMFTLTTIAVSTVGRRVVDRSRAQSVADGAALASVDGGRGAAERLASMGHGVVVSWVRVDADTVVVTVRVGDGTATARASSAP
jgi:hypothetical protein